MRRVRFQLRIGPISREVLYFHDDGQHEMRQSIRDQTSTIYLLQKLQPAISTASDLGISVVPIIRAKRGLSTRANVTVDTISQLASAEGGFAARN